MIARGLVMLVAVLGLAAAAAGQNAVALRRTAALDGPSAVTVGTVAEVTGPEAERLRGIVVLERAEAGTAVISVAEVRAALGRAKVNWGRVSLSGSESRVAVAGPEAAVPEKRSSGEKRAFNPAEAQAGTVHAAVLARLAELYAVGPEDLRVKLASLPPEAAGVLAEGIGARRVEARPGASSGSGRVPLKVEVFAGDRLERSAAVSAEVLVRRRGVGVSSTAARQQALTDEALVEVEAWLPPGEPAPLRRAEVAGQLARRRIEPGRPITAEDLQSPVVVNRGDVVLVDCLSGGVVLKAKARALGTARDGELVRLQLESGGKPFQARMNGRGRAVMALGPAGTDGTPQASGE